MGVRGIYRELGQFIEDAGIRVQFDQWAIDHGYNFPPLGNEIFVLLNPGSKLLLRADLDFDGVKDDILMTAAELGLPKAKRTYKALELFFEKTFNGKWQLQGSYTYSELKGNYEGWADSDLDQPAAARGPSFDKVEALEGANGPLPGDRPHTLKLYGSWIFSEHWSLSGNFLYQSGRAYGARGPYPEPIDLWWRDHYFYDHGELVPRGSLGRTPDLKQLNLGLQFELPLGKGNGLLRLRADVFNVFDSNTVREFNQVTELEYDGAGIDNPAFLQPLNFQQPRFMRLSARIDF